MQIVEWALVFWKHFRNSPKILIGWLCLMLLLGAVPAQAAKPKKKHTAPKHPHVLKFKAPPDRGQILSPGEKPPAVSIQNSK